MKKLFREMQVRMAGGRLARAPRRRRTYGVIARSPGCCAQWLDRFMREAIMADGHFRCQYRYNTPHPI